MKPQITQSCACPGLSKESGLDAFWRETEFEHETAISNVEAITAVKKKEVLTNARLERPWMRLRR